MRITDVRVDTLSIGPTILRVLTDEGVVGLSELGWHDPAMFRPHLENVIKPLLVGESPMEPGRHWERLYFGTPERPYPTPVSYVGAIDVALWDIVGKVAGLPIHALLGGAARTEIPLYWSTGAGWQRTPQQMLDALRAGWDEGFRSFKIRMDWGPLRFDVDPAKDLEMFRLCREFVGRDVWLGFDANRGYSVGTAIGQGRQFEELGIAHFEEPLPPYDWPGVRQVADALDVPISTGENEATRWTFRDLIAIGNPDILQPDILDAGGISEIVRIFQLAEVHAKPVMPHSPAAGILLAASLHAYATVPSGVRPHEYSIEYGPSPDQLAELFGEAVLPRDGRIRVLGGPGLGLELNERALDRLTVRG